MLVLAGLNHRTTPLEIRERLYVGAGALGEALESLRRREGVREAMVLSTCNRTELLLRWDPAGGDASTALLDYLAESAGMAPEGLRGHVYVFHDDDAVRHLLHVAAGLDSMILGEPQILGQVRQAYEAARRAGATGPILDHVLQKCLAAARRVRRETGIGRHTVSVASASARMAVNVFGELRGRSLLVVGAGKMGRLAVRYLQREGMAPIRVCSRSLERAESLAEQIGGEAAPWDERRELLHKADVVVSCTAAPTAVLDHGQVLEASRARRRRPMLILDLAVPRDVEPTVNDLENVYVYDVDDLQRITEENLEARRKEAARARRLLEAEVRRLARWRRGLAVKPAIVSLRRHVEQAAQAELQRHRGRLGPLSADQEAALENFRRALVQKLLHAPTLFLKSAADREDAATCVVLCRAMFGLPEEAEVGEKAADASDASAAAADESAVGARSGGGER